MKSKIITLITFFIIFTTSVNAASFSMTASKSGVGPSEAFTVSVGGDCIGKVNLSISNGNLSTNSVWVEQGYTSINVVAGSSGVVTITATPVAGFSDSDANPYNPGSRTVSVNIVVNKPTTPNTNTNTNNNNKTPITPITPPNQNTNKSNDNNLSSLSISEGNLSPSFDANITEYSVTLKENTTNLNINATPNNAKAKVDGIGDITLKPGNNDVIITVTAEDNSTKNYLIKVYVEEYSDFYLNYKDKKISIVNNYENIPSDFNKITHSYNEKNITLYNKEDINFIYGMDDNKGSFYLFDKSRNEIISKVSILNINNKTLYVVDTQPTIKKLKLEIITINEQEVDCYKLNDENNNYYLLNTINDKGNLIEYLYEKSENSIVLYPSFLNKNTTNITNDTNDSRAVFVLSVFILLAIAFALYLFQLIRKGERHEKFR